MSTPRATIQPLLDAWAQGDFSAGVDVMAPDVGLTAFMPEGSETMVGVPAIAEYMRRFLANWERYWFEADHVDELSPTRLLARGTMHAKTFTGIEADHPMQIAFEVLGGRVTQMRWDPDPDTAVAMLDAA